VFERWILGSLGGFDVDVGKEGIFLVLGDLMHARDHVHLGDRKNCVLFLFVAPFDGYFVC